MPPDLGRLARSLELELWVARIRLLAVAFAVLEVGILRRDYPPEYELAAWIVTALFAAGAFMLELPLRARSEP
ncbi:MAG TPA: hypothetical protein VF025_13255 [Gaiellaceae bacterium]